MWYTTLSFVVCLVAFAKAQTNETISSVTEAFTSFAVVPDVLSSFAPIGLLDVVFTDPSTGAMLHVTPGTNLTMERTSSPCLRLSQPFNTPHITFFVVSRNLERASVLFHYERHFTGQLDLRHRPCRPGRTNPTKQLGVAVQTHVGGGFHARGRGQYNKRVGTHEHKCRSDTLCEPDTTRRLGSSPVNLILSASCIKK